MTTGTAVRTCTVADCAKPSRKRGMCETHHSRWKRTGTTDKVSRARITPHHLVVEVRPEHAPPSVRGAVFTVPFDAPLATLVDHVVKAVGFDDTYVRWHATRPISTRRGPHRLTLGTRPHSTDAAGSLLGTGSTSDAKGLLVNQVLVHLDYTGAPPRAPQPGSQGMWWSFEVTVCDPRSEGWAATQARGLLGRPIDWTDDVAHVVCPLPYEVAQFRSMQPIWLARVPEPGAVLDPAREPWDHDGVDDLGFTPPALAARKATP